MGDPPIRFDREAAKRAGYTDAEIDAYLASQGGGSVSDPPESPGLLSRVGRAIKNTYFPDKATREAEIAEIDAKARQRWENRDEDTAIRRARAMAQGLTFNFADEIEAGVRAPFSSQSFDEILSDIQADNAAYRRAVPGVAQREELAGALVSGAGLSRAIPWLAKPAQTALGRVGQSTAIGAGFGAAAGAGSAPVGESRSERAMQGALGGAAGGLAIGGGIESVRTLGPMVADFLRDVRAPSANRAKRVVARAAANDQVPMDEVAERLRAAPNDAQMSLADVFGDNSRRMADAAASRPGTQSGALRKALAQRQMQAGEQARTATREATGAPAQSLMETLDQRVAQRAALTGPEFEAAQAGVVPAASLQKLVKSGVMRKAHERAARLAAEDGVVMPSLDEIAQGRDLPGAAAHFWKLGLDDEIIERTARSGGGTASNAVRQAEERKRELLDAMDNALPGYREVRGQYADMSRQLDAVRQGAQGDGARMLKAFPNAPYEDVEYALRGASDEVRQAYALGASRATEEALSNARTQPAFFRRLLGDQREQEKYRLLFPRGDNGDVAFAQWLNEMERQAAMRSTEQAVLGNSATAPRQAAQESLDLGLGGELLEAAPGGLKGLADFAVRRGARGINRLRMHNAAQEVAALYQPMPPQRLEDLIEAVTQFASRNQITPPRPVGVGPTRASALAGYLQGSR